VALEGQSPAPRAFCERGSVLGLSGECGEYAVMFVKFALLRFFVGVSKIRPSALRKPFACQRASWVHRWDRGLQIVATLPRAYHALLHHATKYTGSRKIDGVERNVAIIWLWNFLSCISSSISWFYPRGVPCVSQRRASPTPLFCHRSSCCGSPPCTTHLSFHARACEKVIGSLTEREPPSRREVRVIECS
jgi:hypothetical protein